MITESVLKEISARQPDAPQIGGPVAYFIACVFKDIDDSRTPFIKQVHGRSVIFKDIPYNFGIHCDRPAARHASYRSDIWQITELLSGHLVASAEDEAQAIEQAERMINRHFDDIDYFVNKALEALESFGVKTPLNIAIYSNIS